MSIKYYHLAKDEELPDEFCAIRDIGGEPVEYTFYAPEAENAKMRHDLEEANNQAEEVCIENAKLRELVRLVLVLRHDSVFKWLDAATAEVCGMSFTAQARELGIEVNE